MRFTRGALYRVLQNRIYLGEVVHKGTPYPGHHHAIIDAKTWELTGRILRDNRLNDRTRANARAPSLLAGVLFDDQGNRLSPSHTAKNGKRYRYYVNQALIQFRPDDSGAIRRVPAHEIESLVCDTVRSYLADHNRLQAELLPESLDAELQHRLRLRAQTLVKA